MVIGGSPLQLPAIDRAQEMGYYVAVLDRDANAPGRHAADVFYEKSTIDAEGVVAAARDFRPDAIITIGTDMPMRALARAAAELGLPAPSSVAAFNATDKAAMAHALNSHGVPAPRTLLVSSSDGRVAATPEWSGPVIVKPSDSSGSRGVTLVESADALPAALQYARGATATGRVLMQEYMQGPEVSVEGFCFDDGDVEIVAITDKLTTGAPHFVELGHSQPSGLPTEVQDRIQRVVTDAARALGLSNCALHAEVIVTSEGPKIVEVGARLGGDFITSHLVPLSTGIDMIAALIEVALGHRPALERRITRGSAVRFLSTAAPQTNVDSAAAVPGVRLVSVAANGPRVVRSSTDRLGHIVAEGDSATSAVHAAESAIELLLADDSDQIGV